MSFADAVRSALRQYVTFRGRAARAEYWWFVLFTVLVSFAAGIVDAVLGTAADSGSLGVVGTLVSLAVFLPSLAVTLRRLHDTDRSGWWVLAFLIPLAGFVLWLVFMLADSSPYPNRYGPSPKPGAMPGPAPARGRGAHGTAVAGGGYAAHDTWTHHDHSDLGRDGGGFDGGSFSD